MEVSPQPSYNPKPIDDMSSEELQALWTGTAPVEILPWNRELALRAARVPADLPRDAQLSMIRTAIDDDVLPDEAVDALIEDGFPELDDLDVDDDVYGEDDDELPSPRTALDGF